MALLTPTLWTDLCVSTELPDEDDDESYQMRNAMKPNARRIATFLNRSGNAPIDILINARDPEWDLSETEYVGSYRPCNTIDECHRYNRVSITHHPHHHLQGAYTHPFLSSHMHAILDLFMPHIRRFRSLAILTDTCSPMYAAVNRLSDPKECTLEGAPLLESIVLKRCNEYIGNSTEFFPREMKSTAEIPFAALLNCSGNTFLPRLRELRLHGVHVNWSNLPPLLDQSSTASTPKSSLRTLELSEHPYDVRPCLADFRRILQCCTELRKLVVNVSGPIWDQDDSMGAQITDPIPIHLPHLKELTLGYTDVDDARHVLNNLNALNITSLCISDNSSVLSPETEDAGSLLIACGVTASEEYGEIQGWSGAAPGSVSQIGVLVSPPEPHGMPKSSARFPALEEITLYRVESSSVAPFRTFFSSLTALRRLTLQHTSMHAVKALMPHGEERLEQGLALPTSPSPCPCPNLKSVHILGAVLDFDLITSARSVRIMSGAYPFEPEVKVDYGLRGNTMHVAVPDSEEMEVRIRSDDPYAVGGIDFEDAAMDFEEGGKEDPYAPGGVFNDPTFDAYYGPQMGFIPAF